MRIATHARDHRPRVTSLTVSVLAALCLLHPAIGHATGALSGA